MNLGHRHSSGLTRVQIEATSGGGRVVSGFGSRANKTDHQRIELSDLWRQTAELRKYQSASIIAARKKNRYEDPEPVSSAFVTFNYYRLIVNNNMDNWTTCRQTLACDINLCIYLFIKYFFYQTGHTRQAAILAIPCTETSLLRPGSSCSAYFATRTMT